jgi:uncharacterized protein
MSVPITQFVVKVHSRCDLACDHCYVYEHADQSWRDKPRAIDRPTAERAAERIAEHAAGHLLSEVQVVLHGGEPLLLGAGGLRMVLAAMRSRIAPVTRLDLRMHTNGVLLDERLCELFAEYGVQVGVSLDGDRAAQDRHRLFADGRSSHGPVRRALALLREPRYRHLYAGILCTVDLSNDPIAVYEALLAEAPPRLDLLLPHATWDHPPPRPSGAPAPYAAWLRRIHARWTSDGHPVPIRLFDSVRSVSGGGPSFSEAVGLDPADLLTVETDGGWEQADSLKTAYDGAPATGMDVFSHSVDEVAKHPGVGSRLDGLSALCGICRACPVVRICGGGLYAHRYRAGSGFDNPSVYCADLKALITGVTEGTEAVTAGTAVTERTAVTEAGGGTPGGTAGTGGTARGNGVTGEGTGVTSESTGVMGAATGNTARPARPSTPEAAPAPAAAHLLPAETFDSLAAGPGGTAAIESLVELRASVTRALVAAVGAGPSGDGELGRATAEGWELLSRLDAERPSAVREVLAHPYVQAWAVRCLHPPAGADVALDRAHLAGIAAAAALRAGERAEPVLPVRDGALHLPSFGALTAGPGSGPAVRVVVSPDGLAAPGGGHWRTVRRCVAGGVSVSVEDVDPFRDCQRWPVADRLPETAWRTCRPTLAAALSGLARELPAYADALGAGLRTVVPLRADPAGSLRAGTARHAFGAVAVAFPAHADELTALLLHEFQHVKLNALLDLYDLCRPADTRLLRVPWRPDPRPAEGVLHGVYAHLALAELWRARARDATDDRARRRYRRYRSWVLAAMDNLSGADILTRDGERFVAGMRATADGWTGA